MSELTKECRDCNEVKPLSNYYKSTNACGFSSYCKVCDGLRRRAHYLANKEKADARARECKEKPESRYTTCKYNAKTRNLSFTLTLEAFSTLTELPCEYCGTTQDRRGIDRADSDIGYELGNCYPCCWTCNKMKNDTPVSDWLQHMHKILSHKNLIQ